jgi:phage terminase small subunit
MPKKREETDERFGFTDGITDAAGKPYAYDLRERLFVYHYLSDPRHIASTAAEKAGYSATTNDGLRVRASILLKRESIKAAINAAFESLALPKMEIIYRLGRIAAGSIEDVLNEDNELDLDQARERGTAFLLKRIKRTRDVIEIKSVKTGIDAEGEDVDLEKIIVKEKVEFEIHDPLRALELLGKNGRLFVENIQKLDRHGDPTDAEDPATVIFYLPDNGRGDGDGRPAEPAKPTKAARTRKKPATARRTRKPAK